VTLTGQQNGKGRIQETGAEVRMYHSELVEESQTGIGFKVQGSGFKAEKDGDNVEV
jgi:hypothetical protein